jgi:hypothetical protein
MDKEPLQAHLTNDQATIPSGYGPLKLPHKNDFTRF